MKRLANNTGMPLFIWVRALIVALILLVTLYFFVDRREKRLYGNAPKSGRLEDYTNSQDGRVDVCFLGSSLTGNALILYHSLDNTMARMKEKIHYKVIIGSGVCLQDLNDKIAEIRKLRPKYLFIESNIACIDLTGNELSKFRVKLAVIPLYFIMMGGNAFKLADNQLPASYIEKHDLNLDFDNLKADFYDLSTINFKIRHINDFPEWDSFFKEAVNLGIKIYLLDIPRSMEAEHLLSDKFKQQFNDLVKQYNNKYNIGYIDFPGRLNRNKYYVDRGHFNKSGSYYYCEWLVKELSNGKY
jgi:hypothetical protein